MDPCQTNGNHGGVNVNLLTLFLSYILIGYVPVLINNCSNFGLTFILNNLLLSASLWFYLTCILWFLLSFDIESLCRFLFIKVINSALNWWGFQFWNKIMPLTGLASHFKNNLYFIIYQSKIYLLKLLSFSIFYMLKTFYRFI